MDEKRWFWVTLTLSCITVISVVFAAWELLEHHFFRGADYLTLHVLYITRGVASSLLLAFWATWFVLRQRGKAEEVLRRSRERYRGLLEDFPGAVILFDGGLRVVEWNALAEKMYGYGKGEACGEPLRTVPVGKMEELREFMRRVEREQAVIGVETTRLERDGREFPVELSLRPFRESGGPVYFLEATTDIRERVRLREKMLEIEKLTSMGKMAAGTAHHLNSPLAALLLRVQLMRERSADGLRGDLEKLEEGLQFCKHFVQRLLEFTRPITASPQSQDLGATITSVADFLAPVVHSKRARLVVDVAEVSGRQVMADRNHLETVLLILLSNAMDAIPAGGEIAVRARMGQAGRMEVVVRDNGCGIHAADLERVFEPFFTTKEPGKGTGLGLAIAHNLLMELGGSIRLESEPGKGTTARLELPAAEETALAGGGLG
jgi:PAS domain S-box-containing protein